jgi:pyridoxal phosphate enzyme (YggS family)
LAKNFYKTEKEKMITENVQKIKAEIAGGNAYGERVTLVAAIKMQTADAVNQAIAAGVDAVAENKPQEFRDKNALIAPCPRHFIGHLQTNKVKYLVGEVELFHSCDRDGLAEEIAKQSVKKGVVSNVLVQVNIGNEESKGGYDYGETAEAVERLSKLQGLRVRGLMAMLPDSDDENLLRTLAKKMRTLFDALKKENGEMEYLSMGMSGDYRLCVEEGSNMIRLGSTIFGAREYTLGK